MSYWPSKQTWYTSIVAYSILDISNWEIPKFWIFLWLFQHFLAHSMIVGNISISADVWSEDNYFFVSVGLRNGIVTIHWCKLWAHLFGLRNDMDRSISILFLIPHASGSIKMMSPLSKSWVDSMKGFPMMSCFRQAHTSLVSLRANIRMLRW